MIFGGLPWYIVLPLLAVSLWLMRMKRDYLQGGDSMFVTGDKWNTMVVHGVVTTKTRLTLAQAKKVVAEKMACHTRLRQKIVKRAWKWHYLQLNEDKFDVENHIKVHDLKCDSEDPVALQTALEQYTSTLIQTPIDMSRPPWEFVLIPTYGSSGSAFVVRAHHSIADGVTLMRLAMTIFERVDGESSTPSSSDLASPKSPSSPPTSPSAFKAVQRYRKERLRMPSSPVSVVLGFLKAFIKIFTMPRDPSGLFKPKTNITPSTPVHARWLRAPFDLREMKQLAYATGTTVNDIAFYLISSALRSYALRRHAPTYVVNTVMWVSSQGTAVREEIAFGNKIGAVTLGLPVDVEDDLQRLEAVRNLTAAAQVTPEPIVTRWTLQFIGLIPLRLIWFVWDRLAYNATNSMSNVPGPAHPVRWGHGGPEVDRVVFFVPPQGVVASFITMLSYANAFQIGFLSDSRAVKDPREVLDLCEEEFDKLKRKIDALQKNGKLQETMGLKDEQKEEM
jgi:diacylglycerol O-acyltransferase